MSTTFSAAKGASESRRAKAGRNFVFDQAGVPRPGESAWTTSAMRQHRTVRDGDYVSRERPNVVHTAGSVRRLQGRALARGYGRIDDRDRHRVIADLTGEGQWKCSAPRGSTRIGVSLFPGRPAPKIDYLYRCRGCPACLVAKKGGWTSRAADEVVQSRRARFVTLTYSSDVHWYAELLARREAAEASIAWDRLTAGEKFARQERILYREIVAPLLMAWHGSKTNKKGGYVPFRHLLVTEKHDGKRRRKSDGSLVGTGANKGRAHHHILVMETSQSMLLDERMQRAVWRVTRKMARRRGAAVGPKDSPHDVHLSSGVIWDRAPPKGHKEKHDVSVVRYATKYISKDASNRVRASRFFGKLPGMRKHRPVRTEQTNQVGLVLRTNSVSATSAESASAKADCTLNTRSSEHNSNTNEQMGGSCWGGVPPAILGFECGEKGTTTINDDEGRCAQMVPFVSDCSFVPVLEDSDAGTASGGVTRRADFQGAPPAALQHRPPVENQRVHCEAGGQGDSPPDSRSDSGDSASPDAGRLGRAAGSGIDAAALPGLAASGLAPSGQMPHASLEAKASGWSDDEIIRDDLLEAWAKVAPSHARPSRFGVGILRLPETGTETYASPQEWQASLRQPRDVSPATLHRLREQMAKTQKEKGDV